MTAIEKMEKEVMLADLFLYMREERSENRKCSIEQAYDELVVPENMRMTVIEIIKFLYPSDTTEKSLQELLIEHYVELNNK